MEFKINRFVYPAAVATIALAGIALGEEAQLQTLGVVGESRSRFDAQVALGAKDGKAASAHVAIRLLQITGTQRLEKLEVPFGGDLIVELRAGNLVTIIAGERVIRHAGEFWTVKAGTPMGIETLDNVATLQTTLIGPP
jgi:hypothetical protein